MQWEPIEGEVEVSSRNGAYRSRIGITNFSSLVDALHGLRDLRSNA